MRFPDERRPGHPSVGSNAATTSATRNEPEPVEGAGGVTFDALGRVLILRHVNGDWVFPKGHVEPGESLLQAALREVREETGVQPTCPDPRNTRHTSYRNAHGVLRRITWFTFVAPTNAVLTTEPLFEEALFAPCADALGLLTFEQDRELLTALAQEEWCRP